jgi:hypothetical protein
MEPALLTSPLASLGGQVIILSNADTYLFRTKSRAVHKYPPAEDLDFWVNMRVYLDDEKDSFGVTKASDETPSAVLVDLDRVLAMTPQEMEKFAMKGRKRFVIAMGQRTQNPSPKEVEVAINTLGINSIPIDIFTDSTEDVTSIVREYSSQPYHPKPTALRSV